MDIKTLFNTPFDAESYIENWLLAIADEEERAFSRKYLAGSLKAMIQHTERSYQALEERVYAEVKGKEDKHRVYITLVDREKYDITNGVWFPVISGDEIPLAKKNPAMAETLPMTLEQRYCPGNQQALDILRQHVGRKFSGRVIAGGKEYAAMFCLKPSLEYRQAIEDLYALFQKNAIPWVTLNCGYLLRFFAIQLVEAEGIKAGQEIQSYTVDLEELEVHLFSGYLPIWNIQNITYDSNRFVRPAVDMLYFEHVFPMDTFGKAHGYLLESNGDILSFRQTEEEILILTVKETFKKWQARQIIFQPLTDLYCIENPIMHNGIKGDFIYGYTKESGVMLRSKGELMRRVNAFGLSEYVKLLDVQLLTDAAEKYDGTHLSVMNVSPAGDRTHNFLERMNLNWFLQDDLINRDEQKVLLFRFQRVSREDIWYDMLSFILSEIQRQFSEYRCEAELTDKDRENGL